jgi:hypothetical protein
VQSSWSEGGTTRHKFGRGPFNDYFIKNLFQLRNWFQTRIFLCEFPIWSDIKLSAAVRAILVHGTLREIHIKTILSGTSCSIKTKLWWNSHWMVFFQNCVRQSRSPTKTAATVDLGLTYDPMGNSHKNLLVCSVGTKFWWNVNCMCPFKNCIR